MTEQSEQFPWAKLILVLAIIGIAVAGWLTLSSNQSSQNAEQESVPVETQAAPVVNEPEPQPAPLPVEETIVDIPELELEPAEAMAPPEPEIILPSLDESDAEVVATLEQASWFNSFTDYLVDDDLIRKFVTFVDNASRGDVAKSHSVVTAPADRFEVAEQDVLIQTSPRSFSRYDVYVSMLTSLDEDSMMLAYQKYLPLMQQAYAELGYAEQEFNGTLIDAIDRVLATPVVADDFKLVVPKAMYQFEDQKLENLPAIQKQLIRMGSENAEKVKAVLQSLRAQLIALDGQVAG